LLYVVDDPYKSYDIQWVRVMVWNIRFNKYHRTWFFNCQPGGIIFIGIILYIGCNCNHDILLSIVIKCYIYTIVFSWYIYATVGIWYILSNHNHLIYLYGNNHMIYLYNCYIWYISTIVDMIYFCNCDHMIYWLPL